MSFCVIKFTRRATDVPLALFRDQTLHDARARTSPAGCTGRAHSHADDRAYRHGDPAFDAVDEYMFDEIAAAQAWRSQTAADGVPDARGVGSALTLLTRVLPVLPGGAPPEGLKHVELLKRRAGMGRVAFAAYWRDTHGPLAAALPMLRRYVQLPAEDSEYAQSQPRFDGVALLWFDSIDTLREGARQPAFQRTRDDMTHFADTAASTSLLTREIWSSSQD